MTDPEIPNSEDTLEFSKETRIISGNRKLYIYKYQLEPDSDSGVSSTGNIGMEGTKTDD